MKQSYEGMGTHTNTLSPDYEAVPEENTEYDRLVDAVQAIARERQQYSEYGEYGEVALVAKQRDWATLSDRLAESHSFTEDEVTKIKTELSEAPPDESLQLLQQLTIRGLVSRDQPLPPTSPKLKYVSFHERKAERERQVFINHFLDLSQRGEDAMTDFLKKPDTKKAQEFIQGLTPTTINLVTNLAQQSYGRYNTESSREDGSLTLRHFAINPDQPLNELRYQAAEKVITQLDQSTHPLQQLEQLARLDSQYIAGFIRSYEEFDGVDRNQLIGLLAEHDPEQVIHLAKEKVIDKTNVTAVLTNDQLPPVTRGRLSVLAPDSIENTELSELACQLPITELYQLSKDSQRWHDLIRHDVLVQSAINQQLASLVDQQPDSVSKVNLLNRFVGLGASEGFIAEQKEILYEDLLDHATATNLPIDKIPNLDATAITQLLMRRALRKQQTVVEALDSINDIEDGIYNSGRNITPAEQTKLLEKVLAWREQLTPSSNDKDELELDAEMLDAANRLLNPTQADPTHPSFAKDLVEKVLALTDSYLDKRIASPYYQEEGGVFDNNVLSGIANITQNPELAAKLAAHLSPTSVALNLMEAAERQSGRDSLSWLQLVDPKTRQDFLDRAPNQLATGLVTDRVFADNPEERAAALVKVMTHTGLGAPDLDQLRIISQTNENVPGSMKEARFLLHLYKQYGQEAASKLLNYIPLYKLRGDNEDAHISIINESLRSGNVFLARFGIDYFEIINKLPGGYEQWQAIQASTEPYFTHRAEVFARPEYANNLSLLTKYKETDEGSTRGRFEEEYNMYRDTMLRMWQSRTTGMTHEQIDATLASLTEIGDTSLHGYGKPKPLTLTNMADKGYLGLVLLEYSRHEKVIREIMNNDAVVGESLKVTNILDSENMRQTIEVLLQSASELSSSFTDAQRYAHIASNIVMQAVLEGKDDWRGEVSIPSDTGPVPLSSMTQATYETLATQTLTPILEVPIEERNHATTRNIERARLIEQLGSTFVIPKGSFIHETDGYDGVLRGTANLAGEHLGVRKLSTDSYPGFVDLVKTNDEWGNIELGSYATHKLRYGGGSALVYLPEADLTTQPEPSSGITGHHLAFGGIANTKLGLIIDLTDDKDHIEAARQAQVEVGLYTPLVDRAGNLLFTPEDYQERFEELKQYQTLPDLVKTDVYSTTLYETPDPGGVGSIAEHMERSVAIASDLVNQAELDDHTANIVLAAMKLHDVGKTSDIAQEISNVAAARNILRHVDELTSEDRRRVLLLIRHDELLGEILKSFELDSPGVQAGALPRYTQQKLDQFNRVFENDTLRRAAVVVYQADVAAKRPEAWTEWQISDKLAHIGLPVYQSTVNHYS